MGVFLPLFLKSPYNYSWKARLLKMLPMENFKQLQLILNVLHFGLNAKKEKYEFTFRSLFLPL